MNLTSSILALDALKNNFNKRKSDIQRLCDGEIPTSTKFPFKKEFRDLENLDLPGILEAIHDFQARLECMKSVNSEVNLKNIRQIN